MRCADCPIKTNLPASRAFGRKSRVKMQALQLTFAAALILGCSALELKFPPTAGNSTNFPSAGNALSYGTEMLMAFTNMTQCPSCPGLGCCPLIVTAPPFEPKVASVIQPVTGYRGNVAIIVDWGPRYPWGRACTTSDHGFIVFVSWGDGTSTVDYLGDFGPYQKLHQYPECDRTYGVTVYYCSNPPPYYPSQRCCDSVYRPIDVSYDPAHIRMV